MVKKIAKETQELLKKLNFSKFSNDPKNFSRHCGGSLQHQN